MFKKLLVAVLALTMIIGLFSSALAANDQRIAKRLAQPITKQDVVSSRAYPCDVEWYDNDWAYLWTIPDGYGSDYYNMRFTNATACTLKTVYIFFLLQGSAGSPGATVYLSHSDVNGMPNFTPGNPHLNDVCTSIPIPVVTMNSWTALDVTSLNPQVFIGDFNVSVTPIYNDPSDVLSMVSDDGTTPSGRGGMYSNYPGYEGWYLLADFWNLPGPIPADVNLAIEVEKCCFTPFCEPMVAGTTPAVADPNDQWPIWCHDFCRSSQTGISLGSDICGISFAWKYDIGAAGAGGSYPQLSRTSALIVNDKVYVFYTDRVSCLNLLTGAPIWSSFGDVTWGTIGTLNSDPAIVDGYLYMGTGSGQGFIKVNALTGAVVWGRGALWGNALASPGATAYAPPVVLGSEVFFGNQAGSFYGLDIATGATLHFVNLKVLPTGTTTNGQMAGSVSTDGTNLFIGVGNSPTAPTLGCVYSLKPGVSPAFIQNWAYVPPTAIQAAYPGGFISAPSYRCGNLYIHPNTVYNLITGTSCGGTGYCGYRMNLDPATGVEQWASYYVQGSASQSPPATIGTPTGVKVVFANITTGGCQSSGVSTRGIRCVNSTTNATLWGSYGVTGLNNMTYCAATVTQDPWVFYGTADPYGQNLRNKWGGDWKIVNGNTGATVIKYALSGYVLGTAIAHGTDDGSGFGNNWMVVTTRWTQQTAKAGVVFAFRDKGPRPRLVVPSTYVTLPAIQQSDPIPVPKTAVGAIRNTGCLPLDVTLGPLSDVALMPVQFPALAQGGRAEVSTVSSASKMRAASLASGLIDQTVEDLAFTSAPKFLEEQSSAVDEVTQVKPAAANSSRLAVPTWVVLTSPNPLTIAANGAGDLTFDFYRDQMQFAATNTFYVDIVSSTDPDYNIENWIPTQPLSEIRYDVPYVYCVSQIEYQAFGDVGVCVADNFGLLGSDVWTEEFSPLGTGDNLFQGTMFYMTSMNDAAWNPVSGGGNWDPLVDGGFLLPFMVGTGDCGGCEFGATLPVAYTTDGGSSYGWVTGDVCNFAMIDTGQGGLGFTHETGPSIGILVKSKEIAAYTAPFGQFKLIVQTIINRNNTTITGLYYGSFIDWDIATDVGGGDGDKGFIYQYAGDVAFGTIGLPSKGSYWPDGTKTDPMYNGRVMSASDYQTDLQFDSLYAWVDNYAENSITIKPPASTGTDKSQMAAYGKVNLGPYAEHTFGVAEFGITSGFTGPTDVDNLRSFINKFAGFGRGDIDNNNIIDLRDVVRLQRFIHSGGPGPVPFRHLGDVDNSTVVDNADVLYLAAYFFTGGAPPKSTFMF
jgi:hypothetical protein